MNFISRIIKSINAMRERLKIERHEAMYGPHYAGIDPGVAALLQNANKGNMDPAALMAMMNNGGFGGNGGWWWIWIILIFFCWGGFGGNGFGRGSDDASRLK